MPKEQPGTEFASAAQDTFTKKDRFDLYLQLAQRASARFESKRSIEWRISFALWTAFGGGTAFFLTLERPIADSFTCIAATLSFVVLVVYLAIWIPYIGNGLWTDSRTAYWWETLIEGSFLPANEWLPEDLSPSNKKFTMGDWFSVFRERNLKRRWFKPPVPSMYMARSSDLADVLRELCCLVWNRLTQVLHVVQWMQIALTLALFASFIGALVHKS